MSDPAVTSDTTILTPRALRAELVRIVETSCESEGVGPEEPLTFKLAWHIATEINRLLAGQHDLLRQGG